MTDEDWVKVVFTGVAAAVASGLASGIATWVVQKSLANRTRRADYLKEQIKNLYGPLAFFFESGHRAWDVHQRISRAYEEHFKNTKGERFEGEAKQIIDVQNQYGERTRLSNNEAAAVLRANWGWLDPDDFDEVGKFLLEVERAEVEASGEKMALPLEFYESGMKNALRSPVVYRFALVELVRGKLVAKQAELAGLKKAQGPRLLPPGQLRQDDG